MDSLKPFSRLRKKPKPGVGRAQEGGGANIAGEGTGLMGSVGGGEGDAVDGEKVEQMNPPQSGLVSLVKSVADSLGAILERDVWPISPAALSIHDAYHHHSYRKPIAMG